MPTINQLLTEHRQLRCLVNANLAHVQRFAPQLEEVKPLRVWKAKKHDLLLRVAELRRLVEVGRRGQKVTIQVIAEEALVELDQEDKDGNRLGHPYPYILARVRRYFPEARTTTRDLAWYASKMRGAGIMVPFRPRAKNGSTS